jgi:hypothetical protein
LLSHLRVVGALRHVVVQHSSGATLWMRPLTLGLRVQ